MADQSNVKTASDAERMKQLTELREKYERARTDWEPWTGPSPLLLLGQIVQLEAELMDDEQA